MDQFDDNYEQQPEDYQRPTRRSAQPTRRSARTQANSSRPRRSASSRGAGQTRSSARRGSAGSRSGRGSGRMPSFSGEGFSLEAVKPYTQEIMLMAACLLALISLIVGFANLASCGGSGEQANNEPAQEMTAAERMETAEMSTDEKGIVHGTTTDGINFTIRGAGSNAQAEDKVTFAAAGSQITSDTLLELTDGYGGEFGDGVYDFSPLYRDITSFIQGSDLRFINQDGPVSSNSGAISGSPTYIGPESCIEAIANAGFNLVSFNSEFTSIADTQTMSYSQDVFAKYPEIVLGGSFRNQTDAETVQMIERNGIRFAFLSYNSISGSMSSMSNDEAQVDNDQSGSTENQDQANQDQATQDQANQDQSADAATEGATDASDSAAATSESSASSQAAQTSNAYLAIPFSEATARADIERAKKVADVVIVSMHWGSDRTSPAFQEDGSINVASPNSDQTSQAKWLAEQGVDLVVGTHVHGVQPVEWATGADGKRVPVVYGLGDFVSGQTLLEDVLSGIFTCEFVKNDEDGAISIQNSKWHPTIEWDDGSENPIRVRLLEDMSAEDVNINTRVADEGDIVDMIYRLTTATIKDFEIVWGKLSDAVKNLGSTAAGTATDSAAAGTADTAGTATGTNTDAAVAGDESANYDATYDETADYAYDETAYDDSGYYDETAGYTEEGTYDESYDAGYDESYDQTGYEESEY